MCNELKRYFIELQTDDSVSVPRYRETEIRREQAANFIAELAAWLKENELDEKVANLAITALGQVQITCEADVINGIRNQDDMGFAAIRQGSMLFESSARWSGVSG